MKKIIKEVIEVIKNTINKEEFITKHKTNEKDFTRKRKLGFREIVYFVLGLSNSCLDFEKDCFCDVFKIKGVSNAAVCKARDKVKFTAFRELLYVTQQLIPAKNKYKGYNIIAVDGVKGELPNTKEIKDNYKLTKGCLYPQFHAVTSFDVLNSKFIDAEIEMETANERKLAYKLLENHIPGKDIILYGRGFASVALIQKLEEKGIYFVARVSKSFIKEINEFTKQKTLDKTIHIDYTQERARKSKVKDVELPYSFDLRCVRIFLKSKQQEILITNLPRKEFKRKDVGHLYSLRWGIEAGFNHLKNALYLEVFVGIKENSIKQEFYSILIKYNITMLFTEEAKIMEINNKKTLKLEYKPNIRKTAVFVVKNIFKMLYSSIKGLTKIINDILCNVVKFKSAIRKNRTFLRKKNSSKYSVGYKRNFLLS